MNINNTTNTNELDRIAGDDIATTNTIALTSTPITTTAGVEAELLDLPQTAAMLNYSVKTIRQMDLNGLLPKPIRVVRHLRFNRTELKYWLRYGTPPRQKWQVIWERIRDKV